MKRRMILLLSMMMLIVSSMAYGITTDNLIAHYNFDANASDSKGLHDGNITNAVPTTGGAGIIDEAFDFNGENTSVHLPASLGTAMGETTTVSINFWINVKNYIPNSLHTGISSFVSLGTFLAGDPNSFIYMNYDDRKVANEQLRVQIRPVGSSSTGEVTLLTNTDNLPENETKMVTIVVNGSTASLYINNVLETSESGASVVDFTGVQSYIGKRPDVNSQRYGNFTIDELSFFDIALSYEQREDLFNNESALPHPFNDTEQEDVLPTTPIIEFVPTNVTEDDELAIKFVMNDSDTFSIEAWVEKNGVAYGENQTFYNNISWINISRANHQLNDNFTAFVQATSTTANLSEIVNATINIEEAPPHVIPSAPTNLTITEVINNTINITWTKGLNSARTKIVMKEGSFPENHTDGAVVYHNNGSNVTIYNLQPNIDYFFSLYADNPEFELGEEFEVNTSSPPHFLVDTEQYTFTLENSGVAIRKKDNLSELAGMINISDFGQAGALDARGNYVAFSSSTDIYLYEFLSPANYGEIFHYNYSDRSAVRSVHIDPEFEYVYFGTGDGNLSYYDLETLTVHEFAVDSQVLRDIDTYGDELIVGSNADSVWLINRTNRTSMSKVLVQSGGGNVEQVKLDENYLYYGSDSSAVYVKNKTSPYNTIATLSDPTDDITGVYIQDYEFMAVSSDDSNVYLYDKTEFYEKLVTINATESHFIEDVVMKDGTLIYVSGSDYSEPDLQKMWYRTYLSTDYLNLTPLQGEAGFFQQVIPTEPVIEFIPVSARSDDNISVKITLNESDTENITAWIYKNGAPFVNNTIKTDNVSYINLTSEQYSMDDVLTVFAFSTSLSDNVSATVNSSLIIATTVPEVMNISFGQENLHDSSDTSLICGINDVENATLRYDYIIYLNGTSFATGNSSESANTSVSLYTLTANLTEVNDTFHASCRGYDGSSYSEWLNSSSFTINGSAIAPTISDISPSNDSTFSAPENIEFTLYDYGENANCSLYFNDQLENSTGFVTSGEKTLTFNNVQNVSEGNYTWYLSCANPTYTTNTSIFNMIYGEASVSSGGGGGGGGAPPVLSIDDGVEGNETAQTEEFNLSNFALFAIVGVLVLFVVIIMIAVVRK
jgi:hypothetical protein